MRSIAYHKRSRGAEDLAPPLDYSDFKDSIKVPFALSQMGIANTVAIARSNARPIAGLKEQGILNIRLM